MPLKQDLLYFNLMSTPPVKRFSRLSLEPMPPSTRSASGPSRDAEARDSSSSDAESDSGSSDDEESSPPTTRSPSKLKYRLDKLSEDAKTSVRDVFSDPPDIALQRCRRVNNTYAFQMTELVPRSIRIRASDSGRSQLTCSCGEDSQPCGHLLWLLDQVTKQTYYDYSKDKPLTMLSEGYPEEIGDPFTTIADHHLDVLAQGLHCSIVDPEADSEELDLFRVKESRELLSATQSVPMAEYRPDIFDRPRSGKKVLKHKDLEQTVFRMLLDDHHFFNYFLSVSAGSDLVHDLFRKLSQRVDHVVHDLKNYAKKTSSGKESVKAEAASNVTWAANHILGCVKLINTSIFSRDRPLSPTEATSAARALVHILTLVVERNLDQHPGSSRAKTNLYFRLVGDKDRHFVLAELNLLPEAASQFLHSLEEVLDQIGVNGAPPSYVEKYRKLIARLRTSSSRSGMKRQGHLERSERDNKRMR